jgi:threonine synthase
MAVVDVDILFDATTSSYAQPLPLPSASAPGAIGNTPVIKLPRVMPEGSASVCVKLEYFNSTGSYKDRMAKTMVEQAEARGTLKPGMTVVEASGGSIGSCICPCSQGLSISDRFHPTLLPKRN